MYIYVYICICVYVCMMWTATSHSRLFTCTCLYLFIFITLLRSPASVWVRVWLCVSACVYVCVFALLSSPPLRCPSHTHPSKRRRSSLKKCPQLNMDNWYYNFPDKHLVYIMYDPYTHTPKKRHTLCISHSTREGHSMGNYLNVRSLCLIWHARSHMTSLTKLFELFGMCISAGKPIPKGIWRQKHRTAKKINIIYLKLYTCRGTNNFGKKSVTH